MQTIVITSGEKSQKTLDVRTLNESLAKTIYQLANSNQALEIVAKN